jgi:hydroxymethylpyrimidine pyrophosphatase-like HAD family hydrolase
LAQTRTAPTSAFAETRRFVLATDLDGTFLGGAEHDRRALYRWIEDRREEVGLIFVTGRDPEHIAALCGAGVPWPDFVIGDVGTTIAEVDAGADRPIVPIEPLERHIAQRWADRGPAVRAALDGAPGLSLQPTAFRYRVSYDYDPRAFEPAALETVSALGLDALISDNRFLDVLPPGVSKGPSLLRLIEHLGVPPSRVLVAGDTLNDLSMFETRLNGAVVGGAEPALVDRVRHFDSARLCDGPGAAGIAEAIAAFDLHPNPPGVAA